MDAVGPPLPTSVVVSKLLASEVFGRIGESKARVADAALSNADACVYSTYSTSPGCSSFRRDIKLPASVSETGAFARKKEKVGLNEGLLPIVKHEGNEKLHSIVEADNSAILLSKPEGKQLIRKYLKKSNSSPCSKRPRADQPENSIGPQLTKSTSEKLRGVTKKRGQDGKRSDKRNFRVAVKAKFDSFISKNGLASSDSTTGGNNILGIYGLKSGLRDVTKNVAELPLDELLNGSCKYPIIFQDKGKSSPSVNETILLSVKKACSILGLHKLDDSSGIRKVSACPLSSNSCSNNIPDLCDEDKCIEDSVPSSMDSSLATRNDSPLYQPKVILERLALPPAQDLDALLLESGMHSVPFQSTTSMTSFQSASLPPFPWSSSHSGPCKSVADSCKFSTNRNTYQGRWIRIGSSSRLIGLDHTCFPELDLMTPDHTEDPSNPKKLDVLFQDIKTLALGYRLPYDGADGKTCNLTSTSESHVLEGKVLNRESGIMSSCNSLDLNNMEKHTDSSDVNLKFGSKDPFFLRNKEAERSVPHEGKEPKSVNPLAFNSKILEPTITDIDSTMRRTHCRGDSGCCYPCRSTPCEQYLLDIPAKDISKSEDSPKRLAAAEILYEISGYFNVNKKRDHDSGKLRRPNTTLHAPMKVRKSSASVGKTNGLSQTARPYDPTKNTALPSSPQKMTVSEKKNKLICMDSVGRVPIRWSVPMERAFPDQLERDLAVDQKPFHGSSSRFLGLIPLPPQREKGDNGHQRFRKGSMTTTSGTYRGRSKKE